MNYKNLLVYLLCSLFLSACGQQGPLYLPGDEPPIHVETEEETEAEAEAEAETNDNEQY